MFCVLQKVITKASLAKKVIKKNITANSKVTFDEDGVATLNTTKQKSSEMGQKYEIEDNELGGLNLSKAKEVLKAEDKFDRQLERAKIKIKHKEEKMKKKLKSNKRLKEAKSETISDDNDDDGDESVNLDWLPDPDKIYGKESGSEDDESEAELKKRKWKPPKKERETGSKKVKYDINDDEDLALQLLNN